MVIIDLKTYKILIAILIFNLHYIYAQNEIQQLNIPIQNSDKNNDSIETSIVFFYSNYDLISKIGSAAIRIKSNSGKTDLIYYYSPKLKRPEKGNIFLKTQKKISLIPIKENFSKFLINHKDYSIINHIIVLHNSRQNILIKTIEHDFMKNNIDRYNILTNNSVIKVRNLLNKILNGKIREYSYSIDTIKTNLKLITYRHLIPYFTRENKYFFGGNFWAMQKSTDSRWCFSSVHSSNCWKLE